MTTDLMKPRFRFIEGLPGHWFYRTWVFGDRGTAGYCCTDLATLYLRMKQRGFIA